jgi:hypothetical protein
VSARAQRAPLPLSEHAAGHLDPPENAYIALEHH